MNVCGEERQTITSLGSFSHSALPSYGTALDSPRASPSASRGEERREGRGEEGGRTNRGKKVEDIITSNN